MTMKKRRQRIAILAASAAVLVGAGIAYFVTSSTTASAPEGSQESAVATKTATAVADTMVTLTLHAMGDRDTVVMHTCTDKAGKVAMCSATVSTTPGAWSERVTVPAGTTVSVQVGGGMIQPWCSITDEADRVPPLAQDHVTGMCEVVAG